MPHFPRALVFAHFDPHGLVDPHTLHALRLYHSSFQMIVFVTTTSLVSTEEVSPLVDAVIQRPNVGWDFYSWKAGLERVTSPADYYEVMFCNNSVYGPLYDLDQALLSPTVKNADFWGMSFSRQVQPHIQSYFFGMRHRLFESGIAQEFWHRIESLPDKQDVIDRYEVTMMKWFQDKGCVVGSIYHPPETEFRNPSLYLWRELLVHGVPYLKVALLSEGATRGEILDHVGKVSRFPQQLINSHLARVHAAQTP